MGRERGKNLRSKTPHSMHHTTLSPSSSNLSRHIQKTLNLPIQIAIRDILSVLSPFARKHTAFGCLLRHRRHGISHQRQPSSFIQPSTLAGASRKDLVQEGCVNDSDGGFRVQDEGDGDAEHGEEVCVVYGAVKGVDAPCWCGGDEVVF